MSKEGNKFSAFKLFYDNFVDNLYEGIDYSEIIYNINKIKKLVYKFDVGVYDNISIYSSKLKRFYLRLKKIYPESFGFRGNSLSRYFFCGSAGAIPTTLSTGREKAMP